MKIYLNTFHIHIKQGLLSIGVVCIKEIMQYMAEDC